MGATGADPEFPSLPIDPIRAWLNRHLSFADMMRFIEWQEFCNEWQEFCNVAA